MPIPYHPDFAEALWCEYDGMEPEMTKRRMCVVITPKALQRHRLTTVVPISASEPQEMRPWHVRLSHDPLPGGTAAAVWAKCDMVSAVSLDRLGGYYRRWNGKRDYRRLRVGLEDMVAIRTGVAAALGLSLTA